MTQRHAFIILDGLSTSGLGLIPEWRLAENAGYHGVRTGLACLEALKLTPIEALLHLGHCTLFYEQFFVHDLLIEHRFISVLAVFLVFLNTLLNFLPLGVLLDLLE